MTKIKDISTLEVEIELNSRNIEIAGNGFICWLNDGIRGIAVDYLNDVTYVERELSRKAVPISESVNIPGSGKLVAGLFNNQELLERVRKDIYARNIMKLSEFAPQSDFIRNHVKILPDEQHVVVFLDEPEDEVVVDFFKCESVDDMIAVIEKTVKDYHIYDTDPDYSKYC